MEFNQDFDYSVFDSLIEKNICFAVYRQARQQDIHLVLQTSQAALCLDSLLDLNGKTGFVIAPFHISKDTPLIVIYPDICLNGEEAIFNHLSSYRPERIPEEVDIHGQTSVNSFSQYSSDYTVFYKALAGDKLQKLVLSRTFDVERKSEFSVGKSFHEACGKYHSNFVFLCNTPQTGAWMGISPELLVSEQDGIYKTVALAGTKKVSSEEWDDKNRKEQQIVVDYMQQQLDQLCGDVIQSGPFTAQAGNIEHLKTKFSFKLKDGYRIGDLLALLHPSPAVCGFPKESAFDFILKNESYDRRYYSGFVGPLDIDGSSRLYVNLRCMQMGDDLLRLYAGGGMLLSSELKSEWEETENKLQTILSVI